MHVLIAQIVVGNFSFIRAKEVEIRSSSKTIADTASIELPNLKKLLAEQVGGLNGIKVGDPVEINLGYGEDLVTEFIGFVKRIEPNIPLKLECEDYAFVLRRKSYSKSWRNTTLKEVLNYLIEGTDIILDAKMPKVDFEKFRLDKVNGVFALEKIKEEFGLSIYFRGTTLMVGEPYTLETYLPAVQYEYGVNIIDSDLTFREKDDVKIKLRVVGVTKDNKQQKVEVGDPDGELRTMHRYGITDETTLKRLGNKELEKYKYDGYEGSILTFGRPFCLHSYVADYRDPNFPSRAGKYFIDSVLITWGIGGYRRKPEFGLKLTLQVKERIN
ncbi:MAG: late control protein [Bacteroidota bacterium]